MSAISTISVWLWVQYQQLVYGYKLWVQHQQLEYGYECSINN